MADLSELLPLSVLQFQPKYQTSAIDWQAFTPFAAWVVTLVRPRLLVELGTYRGDSFCAFCQAIREGGLDCRAYAVDTWAGDADVGSYGPEVFDGLKDYLEPLYGDFSRLLRMSFDEAAASFEDASIDVLHIDGLHSYEAVRHDFATWLPKLRAGGVILFHDVAVKERGFGVERLWRELRERYPGFELSFSNGLGVLLTDLDLASPPLAAVCRLPEDRRQILIAIFKALGDRVVALAKARYHAAETQRVRERLGEEARYHAAETQRVRESLEEEARRLREALAQQSTPREGALLRALRRVLSRASP